jgi:hypothetical protein
MRFGESSLLARLGWIALAVIVLLWIKGDPHGAAHAARSAGSFFSQVARAFGVLMGSL